MLYSFLLWRKNTESKNPQVPKTNEEKTNAFIKMYSVQQQKIKM